MLSDKTTPLVPIELELFKDYGVSVWMKRDDLNHPEIQGNKWHKLKLNLQQAKQMGKDTLLTFGGAYSNHIAATAAAAKAYGFKSIGMIRGEELANRPEKWSHTLKRASDNGMQFIFMSRQAYRERGSDSFIEKLQKDFPGAYLLPEGGSNALAVKGLQSLAAQINHQCPEWTHLYTAVGTGGTLAGLVKYTSVKDTRKLLGVAVLKQADYLLPQIRDWIGDGKHNAWQLLTEYHCGGYGKTPKELLEMMTEFKQKTGIPLEPIYTAKMIHAFLQELNNGKIPAGSKVVLLHTGGLQGNAKTTINS